MQAGRQELSFCAWAGAGAEAPHAAGEVAGEEILWRTTQSRNMSCHGTPPQPHLLRLLASHLLHAAMLLTGYYVPAFNNAQGISAFSGTPYFMVKNSWGTWWGEKVSRHIVLSWHTCMWACS